MSERVKGQDLIPDGAAEPGVDPGRRSFLGTLGLGAAAVAATATGLSAAPATPARRGQTLLTSFNVALQETGGLSKPELDRIMAEVNQEIQNKIVKDVLKRRLNQAGLEGTPFEIAQHSQFSLHGNATDTGGNG